MKRFLCGLSLLLLLFPAMPVTLSAQPWVFAKEKEGIRLYTRTETGKELKAYRGITDINAPAASVFAMIEDVNNTDWWDKNLSQIKVLLYEKNKRAKYYLVYDLPWPVTDRDLAVDVIVTCDPDGGGSITAVAVPGMLPEKQDLIRMRDYRQVWTIRPAGKDRCHVELEGYANPAGAIPDWLTNMIIVDSPIKVIGGVKERMEKK